MGPDHISLGAAPALALLAAGGLLLVALGNNAARDSASSADPLFWGGLVVLGLVIPLLVDVLGARWVPAVIPALLVLVGGFILRYVVVMTHA